jgi:hypothetical protein
MTLSNFFHFFALLPQGGGYGLMQMKNTQNGFEPAS